MKLRVICRRCNAISVITTMKLNKMLCPKCGKKMLSRFAEVRGVADVS